MLNDDIVFLLDVDNTLLDNDRFGADLGQRLESEFGVEARKRYWSIFEDLRAKLGFADYLGSLQAFRTGLDDDPRFLGMSDFLLEYQFSNLLFPQALQAIGHVHTPRPSGGIVGRRRRLPAAQDQARGHLERGGRRRAHLHSQGEGAGPRAAALPGLALRGGRRQAQLAGRHEKPARELA